MKQNDIPGNRGMLVPQGMRIIPTEESRTNAAYAKLATADEVTGIVLPTDGQIIIDYLALVKETGVGTFGTHRAAIFLHNGTTDNQLQYSLMNGVAVQEATTNGFGEAQKYHPIVSGPIGLEPDSARGAVGAAGLGDHPGFPSTGHGFAWRIPAASGDAELRMLGSECVVFAAAGTYTVSVQFKCGNGNTVFAKTRRLYVCTREFPAV